MSNFKGTKGNWYINRWLNVDSTNGSVAHMPSLLNAEEKEANALLISKAPEMLEMLEKAMSILGNVGEFEIAREIQQLIKEATEL